MSENENVENPAATEEATAKATEAEAQQETETPEGTQEETSEGTEKETPEGTEEGSEADASPNFDKFATELTENGSLAEESYAELEEMGYSRDMVDAYIKGATSSLTEQDIENVYERAGGEEGYKGLSKWASNNLSDEELESFNNAIQNRNTAGFAVDWLRSKMEAVEGRDPSVQLEGGPGPGPAKDVYGSKSDLTAAVRDRRYGRDKEYTKEVEAKIARSRLF